MARDVLNKVPADELIDGLEKVEKELREYADRGPYTGQREPIQPQVDQAYPAVGLKIFIHRCYCMMHVD